MKRNRSSPEVTCGLLLAAVLALSPAEARAEGGSSAEVEVERPTLFEAWKNLVAWLAAIAPDSSSGGLLAEPVETVPGTFGASARASTREPGEPLPNPGEMNAEGGALDPHGGG